MIQKPRQAYGSGLRLVDWRIYVAFIFGGVGDGKKEMLRKKTHVVRKKTHVVRKFFYVASIFGGAARRKNRPPVGTFSLSQMSSAKAERIWAMPWRE